MAEKRLQLVGIGNAIVDVLSKSDDAFLARHDVRKSGMTLIDAERAEALYGDMGPGVEISGGSVANSIAGFAALGGTAGFIGKVRDDQLGDVFRHDIRSLGVAFDTAPATQGPATARCLILVTPDGQRSMSTFLGASTGLAPGDIDEAMIASAEFLYLEGYLWDQPAAKEAFRRAIAAAKAGSTKVALSLSDGFCVDRFRAEFRDLVDHSVDILFANEDEIVSLYEADGFDSAVSALGTRVDHAALTRSEKGSLIVHKGGTHTVTAEPVDKVVDTTGAGDLYAAGFLHGLAEGHPPAECGRIASVCAAEIISHYGARPEADLKALIKRRLAA